MILSEYTTTPQEKVGVKKIAWMFNNSTDSWTAPMNTDGLFNTGATDK